MPSSIEVTQPLPSPPFFTIPNLNNLRDAALYPGGLPTSPGGMVRPSILFRSAEVSKLDRAGWKAVREIGVGTVFDLRSKPEVEKGWRGVTGDSKEAQSTTINSIGEEKKASAAELEVDEMGVREGWIKMMEAEGVKRIWTPVFEEADYSPERLAERYLKYMGESDEGFAEAYHDILLHGGPAFRTILLYLASVPPLSTNAHSDPDPAGALIHCTAGKDRTGIFFGIVFSFLGVPKDLIAAEYNLTELGLLSTREALVSRLMQSPGFKKFTLSQINGSSMNTSELAKLLGKKGTHMGGEENKGEEESETIPPEVLEKGRQAALRMVGARKESMIRALDMVEREWGSAEGYMRKVCRLGDEELEKLTRALVIPVDTVSLSSGKLA